MGDRRADIVGIQPPIEAHTLGEFLDTAIRDDITANLDAIDDLVAAHSGPDRGLDLILVHSRYDLVDLKLEMLRLL